MVSTTYTKTDDDWCIGVNPDESVELLDYISGDSFELALDTDVYLNLEQGTAVNFVFEVNADDVKIVLKVWERELRQGFSDIDIYVSVNDEALSQDNFTWSFKFGVQSGVEIFPGDERLQKGTYRVLMVNRDEDEDEFTGQPLAVRLSLPVVPTITNLNDLEAPLLQNCSPGETCYFQYTIKDNADMEDLLVLMNLSQKSKLQAFLHWTNYPSGKKL